MAKEQREEKEATENNFLEAKKYYLKLIPKQQGMEFAKNPAHAGYGGMFDGAVTRFTLYMDETSRKIINPFKSLEEQKFFENIFGEDMNPNKPDNKFWNTWGFTVVKSPAIIEIGQLLDGNDPKDSLTIKVLRTWKKLVADGMNKVGNIPTYRWVLVPEDYEEEKAVIEVDIQKRIWMHLGSIDASATKMNDFLAIYFASKNKNNKIPSDASREFLVKELGVIANEDPMGYLKIVDDKDYEMKVFINKSIEKGTIKKLGVGTYTIVGYDGDYTYNDLVSYLKGLKKTTDQVWFKLNSQLDND